MYSLLYIEFIKYNNKIGTRYGLVVLFVSGPTKEVWCGGQPEASSCCA